jgi:hypothetical protein
MNPMIGRNLRLSPHATSATAEPLLSLEIGDLLYKRAESRRTDRISLVPALPEWIDPA